MSTMEDTPIYKTASTKTAFQNFKIPEWIKKFWSLILIGLGYMISFYAGHSYDKIDRGFNPKTDKFPITKSRKEVSVSVNDRGELVFMDRIQNQITVYDDTIGYIIYDFYASQLTKK
jgi:hypothetical protein